MTIFDQLEEQIAPARHHRQVADLVHNQERGATQIAKALPKRPVALGFCKRGDEVSQGREHDAAPGLHGFDGQRRRKVALAGAGRPEKVHPFGAINELEFRQRQDAVAIQRGLEGEVEALQGFDGRQARHHQRRLHAAVLAQRELLDQDLVEGADGVDLALLHAPERGIEHLERSGHPETNETALDAVNHRAGVRHDRPPLLLGSPAARRSPMAW
jgi:hypothetical protein